MLTDDRHAPKEVLSEFIQQEPHLRQLEAEINMFINEANDPKLEKKKITMDQFIKDLKERRSFISHQTFVPVAKNLPGRRAFQQQKLFPSSLSSLSAQGKITELGLLKQYIHLVEKNFDD